MKNTSVIGFSFWFGITLLFATLLTACGSDSSSTESQTTDTTDDVVTDTEDDTAGDLEQAMQAPQLDPADQVELNDQTDFLDEADPGALGDLGEDFVVEDNGDLIPAIFPTQTSVDLAYAQASAELVLQLNNSIALPADISVSFADCGTANAFFVPPGFLPDESGAPGGSIIMCHELNELFVNLFNDVDSAFKSSVFVLMHELGHALVDQLELPIFGGEEAAVDGIGTVFSTKIGLAEGVALAGWFFFSQGDTPFFDTHRVGTQRLGDLACWAVGGDPSLLDDPTVADIAEQLVAAGRNCQAEYLQQLDAADTLLSDNIRGRLVDVDTPSLGAGL